MVSTRSTKRSTPPTTTQERPSKIAKTPEKPTPKFTTQTSPTQDLTSITTILLDIEGTICPITFVKDVLFPHFLTALPDHLEQHWSSPELAPYLSAFPPEHAIDKQTLMSHVTDLVTRDVKAPYLKALQGYIWEEGYRSGAYAAPVYEDVLTFLDRWPSAAPAAPPEANDATTIEVSEQKRKQVAIYSSGSVPAQKLFLEHVRDPKSVHSSDLNSSDVKVLDKRPVISGWFDTVNAGPKQEKESYEKIAKELDKQPDEVLFLSDNVKEVKAAIEAGMCSIIVEREGNAPLSKQDRMDHQVITTFDGLDL
jgi:enolase-phosphatase E1